jgi:hypothetical protein
MFLKCGHQRAFLFILQMIHEYGSHGGMILTEENRRTWRKTCPSDALCTNLTGTDHGANSGLRGERSATNRLNHGTAYSILQYEPKVTAISWIKTRFCPPSHGSVFITAVDARISNRLCNILPSLTRTRKVLYIKDTQRDRRRLAPRQSSAVISTTSSYCNKAQYI